MLPEPDTYEKAQLVFVAYYAQQSAERPERFDEESRRKVEEAVDYLMANDIGCKSTHFICALIERYPEMKDRVYCHRAIFGYASQDVEAYLNGRKQMMPQDKYREINNLENAQVVAIEYCEKFCSQDEVRPNISERETAREAFNFIAQNDRDGSARNFFDTLTEQYPRFREELAYFLSAPKKHGRREESPKRMSYRPRMEEGPTQMEFEERPRESTPVLVASASPTPPPSPAPITELTPAGQRPVNPRRHGRDEENGEIGRERLRRTGSPPPTASREFSQASLGHLFLGFQGGPNPNPARPMGAFQPPQRQGFGMDR